MTMLTARIPPTLPGIRSRPTKISSSPLIRNCNGLYIAAGGSFHGWKFLPIIGEYVVALLLNKLEPDLVQRWAWDRSQEGGAQKMLKPTRDLKDLV